MSDLEDRLRSWFAAEVVRAEEDLATARVTTVPRGGRTPYPGLALVGLVIAVLVVVVALRPTASPDVGLGPDGSPRRSLGITGGIVLGGDGLPTLIGGEAVLRIEEARGLLASSGRHVLVAGWFVASGQRCAGMTVGVHPLLRSCGNGWLVAAKGSKVGTGLELEEWPERVENGGVVLRLHTRDPRAATCEPPQRARCEAAIVADEIAWANPDPMNGRFADGIPGDIAGEIVFRPDEIVATPLPRGQRFLLGGWHYGERWFGCGRIGETHPLLDDCSPERIAETPGGTGPILAQARDLPAGPVVIRVHSNDPRSATCPGLARLLCEERLVVDELLWAGDDVTNSEPLRIDEVATALQANREAIEAGRNIGVEAIAIDRTCLRPMPPVIWRATGTSRIGLIHVYPSVAAREEAERHPPFLSGCNGADVLILVMPSAVVENVIVHTQFDKSTSDAERRALADAIARWLREIPH